MAAQAQGGCLRPDCTARSIRAQATAAAAATPQYGQTREMKMMPPIAIGALLGFAAGILPRPAAIALIVLACIGIVRAWAMRVQ